MKHRMPDVTNGKRKQKKMNKGIIILLLLFLSPSLLTAQKEKNFRVMCWNVENLFDIRHDSLKNDYEFLPNALRHWNYTRYKKKLVRMTVSCEILYITPL